MKDKLTKLLKSNSKYIGLAKLKKYPDIIQQLEILYEDTPYSVDIKSYIILNDLQPEDYICSGCKSYKPFNSNHKKFNVFCSKECMIKHQQTPEHSDKIKKGLTEESIQKFKETSLQKYGVDHPMKSKKLIDKQQQTNLEKYGVRFQSQTDDYLEKSKKTSQLKYGTDFYNQTSEFREQYKETNIEQFGVQYPSQNKEIQEKIKNSNIEKYGVQAFGQKDLKHYDKWNDKEFIQQEFIREDGTFKRNEFMEYFGCLRYSAYRKLDSLNIKYIEEMDKNSRTIETFRNKYGVDHQSQKDLKNYDKWFNKEFIVQEFIRDDNTFNLKEFQEFFKCTKMTAFRKMRELDIDYTKLGNTSSVEYEIIEYIKENAKDATIIHSDRTLISPKEIDIVVKNKSFGIEFDGLMYHSIGMSKYSMFDNFMDESLNKKKHLEKTKLCENQKFQLFHIFENEWFNETKQQIWKSMINNKINTSIRIFARKCSIKEVSTKDASAFEEANHLQGKGNSKIKVGLYYNDELLSLMTFGKSRFNKNIEYELIRFCTKLNHVVVGGASKLLKYFERNYNPKSLISYANRRWSSLAGNNGDNLYTKLGLEYLGETDPNYFYFHRSDLTTLYSRNSFQKHKLKDKLENFNGNLTESINMYINDYRKIYDSGNLSFVKYYEQITK